MSMRVNPAGQVESVKLIPREHVTVVESREEIVEELNRLQGLVAEVTQDLAEYDALKASQATAPAAEPAPAEAVDASVPAEATPEAPAVNDGGVQ